MANCILAYPNFCDADPSYATVAVSGGQWEPDLPLTNILTKRLARRARSVNAALTSTKFWVDLGTPRDVRVVAIPFLTASRDARLRVRGFTTKNEAATPAGDSGWSDLYPVVYPFGSLYFGHPAFWDGRMTAEDAAVFRMPYYAVFDAPVIARYWLIEIDDTGSSLGYVEVPRIFIAPGWQPSLNLIYGATQVYEPRTTVVESWGGAEYFDVQEGRRVARFGFDYLPEDEALTWAGDMQRRLGVDGQLFFIFDPDDTVHRHRRSFLARMRTLSPLEYVLFRRNTATFELAEVIG
ncbi:MAG: hypothetical protein ACK53W_12585 [Gemmatimonadota bacterium]